MHLDAEMLRNYLSARFGAPVRVISTSILGQEKEATTLKGYGYGVPVKIEYEVEGRRAAAVLETITPGPFGHEHMADRAQILLWSHTAYNHLAGHVRSLDVGAFCTGGRLQSLGDADEFFILNEFVEGDGYHRDLERLRDGGALRPLDRDRADALCDYLVGIHATRGPDPSLYARRLRELVGHHECIMGILDAYPAEFEGGSAGMLRAIEHECIDWRWRLKRNRDRLRQIHGDFHPWNILFQSGTSFVVLDRSRGEWGDAADDVAALTINYVFFSLLRSGRLEGAFAELFERFWTRYVEGSGDRDLPRVIGPFLAFRGLVVANPVWYPALPSGVRGRLLNFVRAVLAARAFDPARVNEYCESSTEP